MIMMLIVLTMPITAPTMVLDTGAVSAVINTTNLLHDSDRSTVFTSQTKTITCSNNEAHIFLHQSFPYVGA